MSLHLDDTIAALASPPGGAARGIVRVSGPEVRAALDTIFQPDGPPRWNSSRAAQRHSGRILLPNVRAPLDVAVLLWPTRRSYTGEPLAELHLPGSPPLLEAVLSALHDRGARPARPGEFTLRAFLAGRIDLVQAEAVLGVIDAHDHRELETALGQLAGGLSGKIADVRRDLIDLLADLEAGLDFVDEDIEFVARHELAERVDRARGTVERLLDQASERMRTAGTRCVVLAGLPNAGKSTLFNALAGREAALVSPIRGTTRDWLSAELDWQGLAIELIDTAGWGPSHRCNAGRIGNPSHGVGQAFQPADSPVRAIYGQTRMSAPRAGGRIGNPSCDVDADAAILAAAESLRAGQFERADLVVWCTAADLDDASRATDAELVSRLNAENRPLLRVRTRSDLAPGVTSDELRETAPPPLQGGGWGEGGAPPVAPPEIAIAAPSGTGLAELREAIVARLSDPRTGGRELVGMTASRAKESLVAAAAALARAGEAATAGLGEELLAIELRETLAHLGRILGTVYTDDILDRIFSKFCIGK